jgi:hypothetical protein
MHIQVWSKSLRGRDYLGNHCIDRRMVLKKKCMQLWNSVIWSSTQSKGGLLWRRYWTFGIHKDWELLDQLGYYQLLNEGSTPWIKFEINRSKKQNCNNMLDLDFGPVKVTLSSCCRISQKLTLRAYLGVCTNECSHDLISGSDSTFNQ